MRNKNVTDEGKLDTTKALEIIKEYKGNKGALIPVLQKIQGAYGYLPEPFLDLVAEGLKVYLSDVYGVATFYAQFYLSPRGRSIIKVCRGTACHVRGSDRIMEKLSEKLDIKPGEMTKDERYSLEEVACLGACGMAPVMVIDEDTFGELIPAQALEAVEKFVPKNEKT